MIEIKVADELKNRNIISPKVLKTFKNEFTIFAKRFPKAAKTIYHVGCVQSLINRFNNRKIEYLIKPFTEQLNRDNPLAFHFILTDDKDDERKYFDGIYFNEKELRTEDFDKREKEDYIKNFKTHWSPYNCSGIKGIINHELGHILTDFVGLTVCKEYFKDYFKNVKLVKDKPLSKETHKLAHNLSYYACSNINEFMADGFAEYMGEKPRPLAIKIGGFLELAYKFKTEGWQSVSCSHTFH